MCKATQLLKTIFQLEQSSTILLKRSSKGQGLYAKKNLLKGELVFASEIPLAAIPSNLEETNIIKYDSFCRICLRSDAKPNECKFCSSEMGSIAAQLKNLGESFLNSNNERKLFHELIRRLAFRTCLELKEGYANTIVLLQLLVFPVIENKQKEMMIKKKSELLTQLQKELALYYDPSTMEFLSDEWFSIIVDLLNYFSSKSACKLI